MMRTYFLPDPESFKRMTTDEVRHYFLIHDLFASGEIQFHYIELDRAIVGSAVPLKDALVLQGDKKSMAAEYFCQRRELGIFNLGGSGKVRVDDQRYTLAHMDGLYVGRGSRQVEFSSDDPDKPAQFYLVSYPAHREFPTTLIHRKDAAKVDLGSKEQANERTIEKYVHPDGVKSAQLVMGITHLKTGNVWNTLPPHTHQRRTEIYFYFNIPVDGLVFHLCGQPDETRHIVVRDKQAVISPSWSIHAGVGSQNYSFIWSMGGENQEFDDMDWLTMNDLR